MTRGVRVVPSNRPDEVFRALREALGGGGPAVVPRDPSAGGALASAGGGRGAARGRDGEGPSVWPVPEATVAQSVALVIETSGSTGVPKRVALSADALLASAAASAGAMGGQGQWILALPTHYVAGAQVLVRSIAAETEPLYYGQEHFDPVAFSALAAESTHDLRFVSLVPVQLARLVDAAEAGATGVAEALRRFDGILVGGQALGDAIRERAERLGAHILGTYGSSETAGGCVYDGRPIGATVVREVGGSLEIGGPVLAEGYLGDPERTTAAFHEADGIRWYRTGDLGRVAGDGRVVVLGRADNVIISGGEKVLLDEVERAVRALEGFGHAVVVAADDDEWGQVPVVVVDGGTPDRSLADVREFVARRVGRAAAPARVVAVTSLPMLSSGKPDRLAIARLAAGAAGPTRIA
ncbi:AMP-binding protein [Leifsonia sp. NPDC058230]|uniref:AMP-binding protein n=1 Tax=Leifsonia sp. NPDC058230 TaxID=3346391 RepID=UPI0036DD0548